MNMKGFRDCLGVVPWARRAGDVAPYQGVRVACVAGRDGVW